MDTPRSITRAAAKATTQYAIKKLRPKQMSTWNYGEFAGLRELEYREIESRLNMLNDPGAVHRQRLERYFRQENFEDRIIAGYTRGNKAIGIAEGLTPVKIGHGKYGWITDEGDLIRRDDVGWALKSVDKALGGKDNDQFFNAWKQATPKQQALIANELRKEIDWDTFWKESYDPDTGVFNEGHEETIVEILERYLPNFQYEAVDVMDDLEFWEA